VIAGIKIAHKLVRDRSRELLIPLVVGEKDAL
jgi:hypothetical protein